MEERASGRGRGRNTGKRIQNMRMNHRPFASLLLLDGLPESDWLVGAPLSVPILSEIDFFLGGVGEEEAVGEREAAEAHAAEKAFF